jgi:hypothetical protein
MTTKTLSLIGVVMCMAVPALVIGQEGHPMTGSWLGDWGPSATERHRVVIDMKWTGTTLAGVINPGPRAIPFRVATVNPDNWSVRIEADAKDAQGRAVTHVIEGTLDNLGSYNRGISGTWTVGATKGDFRIRRQ